MDTSFSQTQVGLEPEMVHHKDSNGPSCEKRQRISRSQNRLTMEAHVVTRVDKRGVHVSPVKVASGYSTAVGVIVCDCVDITCMDFRARDQTNMREALLSRLFDRYKFEIEGGEVAMKRVKDRALCIMSKAFNTWRTTANKYKDKDFWTVIKKRWPSIREEVWEDFVRMWQPWLQWEA